MPDEYGNIPTLPRVTKEIEVTRDEILFSTVGLVQKGVTLGKPTLDATFDDVIPEGTIIGRKPGDKKYYIFDPNITAVRVLGVQPVSVTV